MSSIVADVSQNDKVPVSHPSRLFKHIPSSESRSPALAGGRRVIPSHAVRMR